MKNKEWESRCAMMDAGNWRFYAHLHLGMDLNEADMEWNNMHCVGKKLVCEVRPGYADANGTRMFIRTTTNTMNDTLNKEGWWDTFTYTTETGLKEGLWVCEAVEYRLDRNGYMNLIVKTVAPVNNIKFATLFRDRKGTWESSAWWLLMSASYAFLPQYDFKPITGESIVHKPNLSELKKRFKCFEDLKLHEVGCKALQMFLDGEIALEEIEDALDAPDYWESLVDGIAKAVRRGNAEQKYAKYPLFAKKVSNNVENGYSLFEEYNVEDYLRRQMDFYDKLVREGKAEPIDTDVLDIVEAALAYRKALKDAEKKAKKEKRKAAKAQAQAKE